MHDCICRLPLLNHGEIVGYTIIDPETYQWARHFRWHLGSNGYPRHASSYLHRIVAGCAPHDDRWADHINRDRLDNRKANLRLVRPEVSSQNVSGRHATSPYRGVSRCKQTGRWAACVDHEGRRHWVGRFDSEIAAARAAQAERMRLSEIADPQQIERDRRIA